MKEHDLGKDSLAAGPAYRAVPSREVLPANEVDHYQLANVQVSMKCWSVKGLLKRCHVCVWAWLCVVSLPQFQGCGLLLTQSYAISSREHTAVLFCVWTPCPSLVLLSAFANQRFVSMLGKGLVSPFFSLSCTVEPVSLPLPLSLSFSLPTVQYSIGAACSDSDWLPSFCCARLFT